TAGLIVISVPQTVASTRSTYAPGLTSLSRTSIFNPAEASAAANLPRGTSKESAMRKTAMDVAGTAIGLGLVLLLAHGTPASGQGAGAPAPRVADAKPGEVRVMTTG